LVIAIARPTVTQTRWRAFLDLPTGRTAFFEPAVYQETKWVLERTRPSDYLFGDQLLCFDLRLRNPSRVAYVTPYAFTRPEVVLNVVQALEMHEVRFISWYPGLDAPVDPEGNHLAPLRRYLQSHYHIAERFADGHTIWQRNNAATSSRPVDGFGPENPEAVLASPTPMRRTALSRSGQVTTIFNLSSSRGT